MSTNIDNIKASLLTLPNRGMGFLDILCPPVYLVETATERVPEWSVPCFRPEGVSIEQYTDEDILMATDELNGRPPKKLGYHTPEDSGLRFRSLTVAAIPLSADVSGINRDRGCERILSTMGCPTCTCNLRRKYDMIILQLKKKSNGMQSRGKF